MHKVFITYHHMNDQDYKVRLQRIGCEHRIFIDKSVPVADIPDRLDDQAIRRKIRDEYLRDSTVTILLVGTETKGRKHVDWEVYSSMIDGSVNKKSGILVVNLPSTRCNLVTAAHGPEEKKLVHPEVPEWTTISTRGEYLQRYPLMPERIVDNLLAAEAYISVVPWAKACDPERLRFLINTTFDHRGQCKYDLGMPMRRHNG